MMMTRRLSPVVMAKKIFIAQSCDGFNEWKWEKDFSIKLMVLDPTLTFSKSH